MNRKGILIIVSGFSGAGKGTIMKELTSRYEQYALSVSATTPVRRDLVRRMGWPISSEQKKNLSR